MSPFHILVDIIANPLVSFTTVTSKSVYLFALGIEFKWILYNCFLALVNASVPDLRLGRDLCLSRHLHNKSQ